VFPRAYSVRDMSAQKPLELILARNLLTSVSTPAFLVAGDGQLLFYNEAAGALLGRSFEETGSRPAEEWIALFGPFDDDGEPMDYYSIPATQALREDRPYHGTFRICAANGQEDIAASAIPIVGAGGMSGGIVIFWPVTDEDVSEITTSRGEESTTS
jgi:PAS domain-containing protein